MNNHMLFAYQVAIPSKYFPTTFIYMEKLSITKSQQRPWSDSFCFLIKVRANQISYSSNNEQPYYLGYITMYLVNFQMVVKCMLP